MMKFGWDQGPNGKNWQRRRRKEQHTKKVVYKKVACDVVIEQPMFVTIHVGDWN